MKSRYEEFAGIISAISRSIEKIERDEMVKYGYKGAYAQYLAVMYRNPDGITSAQLCEMSDRDKAAVSRIIGEMEAKGLVVRQSVTDSMYRAKLVLTEDGRLAAEHVCTRASAAVEAGGQGMSEDNRKVFYEALALISENLHQICRDGIPEKNKRNEGVDMI